MTQLNAPPEDGVGQNTALIRRLDRRITTEGRVTLPAVPGMAQEYAERCANIFASLGRPFSSEEQGHLHQVLEGQLIEAYGRSQRSSVVVSYKAEVGELLNYWVSNHAWTIEETYDNWVATRKPPLFGTQPDARVWALALQADDPVAFRVLDVGAGTGRNTLALARRGHPVVAVELSEKFAHVINAAACEESLDVRVIRRDLRHARDEVGRDYALMVLSEVTSDFRSLADLRSAFELAADCLRPGGCLVTNVFIPRSNYLPDNAAHQFAQQVYSAFFTREELLAAVAGLPLELVSDDNVAEYEEANLSPNAWPPTPWYVDWVTGRDVFDIPREDCPIELRWLVFRKVA